MVTPGLTCGVSMSSTSEASRPATRMPSMSAAVLIVIVMARIIPSAALKSRVSTGVATAAGLRARLSRLHRPPRVTSTPSTCCTSRAATRCRLPRPGAAAAAAGPVARIAGGPRAPRALGLERRAARRAPSTTSWTRCCATATPSPARPTSALIVVMPRLGTVSPWASKATDIAHNCGLPCTRVERVTEYRLPLKSGLLGAASRSTPTSCRPAPRCCTTA